MSDHEAELRALLTRAATLEAERQAACAAQDWPKAAQCVNELRRVWARSVALERQVA